MSRRSSDISVENSITVRRTEGYGSTLLDRINNYRLQKKFVDVILVAENEEFHCHKNILSASSPYFQALFSNDFRERTEEQIVINDIPAKVLYSLIEYVYTAAIEINIENAQDMLAAGSLLQYPEVVTASCDFLKNHLHASNCLGIEQYAHVYNCDDLQTDAHLFALQNFTAVAACEEFIDLPMERLLTYVGSELIDVGNEEYVYKVANKWLMHDLETRRRYSCSINKHIRFGIMDSDFVQKTVLGNPLISSCKTCLDYVNKCCQPCNDVDISPRPSTVARDVVVVVGGLTDSSQVTQSVEMYDPNKDRWSSLPDFPVAITLFSSVALHDDIYVIGGLLGSHVVSSVYRFSSRTCAWVECSPCLCARARHTSVAHNGKIYVFGGITTAKSTSQTDDRVKLVDAIECYDPNEQLWTVVGECPFPRKQSKMVPFGNTLVEVGGTRDDHFIKHDIMESFNCAADGRIAFSGEQYRLPEPVEFAQIAVIDNVFYIITEDKPSMIMLDPSKRLFRTLPPPNHKHVHSGVTVLKDKLYVTGGLANAKPSRYVERYEPDIHEWRSVRSMAVARTFHGCVTISFN